MHFFSFDDKAEFSVSLLQSSVPLDPLENHSNMLIWCLRNIIINVETVVLLNTFVEKLLSRIER